MDISTIILGLIVLGAVYSAWYLYQDRKRNGR